MLRELNKAAAGFKAITPQQVPPARQPSLSLLPLPPLSPPALCPSRSLTRRLSDALTPGRWGSRGRSTPSSSSPPGQSVLLLRVAEPSASSCAVWQFVRQWGIGHRCLRASVSMPRRMHPCHETCAWVAAAGRCHVPSSGVTWSFVWSQRALGAAAASRDTASRLPHGAPVLLLRLVSLPRAAGMPLLGEPEPGSLAAQELGLRGVWWARAAQGSLAVDGCLRGQGARPLLSFQRVCRPRAAGSEMLWGEGRESGRRGKQGR